MELKRSFTQGKMNKDVDVRLIPDGEYIDAVNILVSNSEESDAGSVQNSYGIKKMTSLIIPADAETIGSCSDETTECIYWAVASSTGNWIFEYDELNGGIISRVLEDTRAGSLNVLNFNKSYKITGFNVIYNSFNKEKLLVWTDDLNDIRCINIKRAKGYVPNGFSSEDISLYKRQPHYPPTCTPSIDGDGTQNNIQERFLSFAYRWKYLDGEYSAISTFSNPQFYPGVFKLDYQTNENEGMLNQFNAINIKFDTGDHNVTDVQLVFKESNSNNVWVIDTFNKVKKNWSDSSEENFLFSNNKIYSVLPSDEYKRLFDNVPLRAKAQEFIDNRLIYGNYVQGRDMLDVNGFSVNPNYTVDFVPNALNSVDVVSNILSDGSDNVILEIDFTGQSLTKGKILSIFFRASSTKTTPSNYDTYGNYICSQSFYLDRDYADAFELQSSAEFNTFVSVVLSQDFKGYNTGSEVPANEVPSYPNKFRPFIIMPSISDDVIRLKIPFIEYQIDTSGTITYEREIFEIGDDTDIVKLSNGNAFASCKSNRSYEVGIVYLDDSGRYSTVIVCDSNTKFIPIEYSVTQNKLKLNINHRPPYWATKYKIFVKDNKLEYQTIYGLTAYKEDNYLWVKLEGQEKQKVQDGDFLIVKRDLFDATQDVLKTQVLEYKEKEENFIEGNYIEGSNDKEIIERSGIYMKVKSYGNIDVDGIDQNIVNIDSKSSSKGDNFNLFCGPLSRKEETATPNVFEYFDYPISSGSLIDLRVWNNKFGSNGGLKEFKKQFVAGADYVNFESWFNSEVGGLYPFNEIEFVRGKVTKFLGRQVLTVESSDTSSPYDYPLWLRVKNELNGNGQHASRMNCKIDILNSSGLVVFETDPKDKSSEIFYETPDTYEIVDGKHLSNPDIDEDSDQVLGVSPAILNLSFFNCYTQGNGVESYIVKDVFNKNSLSTVTRPNAVDPDGYKELRLVSSLTYSGAFDKSTKYNSLNEFNLSRGNFVDLDDSYGSIQKIFSKDTNILVFQEDKVHNILYNKNVLNDALGGGQVASIEEVLGTPVPYAGERGIGTDPESFAYFGNRIYFTYAPKGEVCRLSADGIEVISRYGHRDYFRDNLQIYANNFKIGQFDPLYDNYVLALTDEIFVPEDVEFVCNQTASELTLLEDEEFHYTINVGNKIGKFEIQHKISGLAELDFTVRIGEDEYVFKGIKGEGSIEIDKSTTETIARVGIVNRNSVQADFELTNICPETDPLDVIVLVVNDSNDSTKTMTNKYYWDNPTYGYNGFSSVLDTFDVGGITRFYTYSGEEGTGAIPLSNSLVRVSSIKGSGDFTPCNRIGYVITSDNLDAQGILDSAIYPAITTDGDENYIEFTYDRLGDLTKKLYIVWDYIDNVAVVDSDIHFSANIGNPINFDASDFFTAFDDYEITITVEPEHGEATIDGDVITYIHDGDDTFLEDELVYTVTSGSCSIDIHVNFTIDSETASYSDFLISEPLVDVDAGCEVVPTTPILVDMSNPALLKPSDTVYNLDGTVFNGGLLAYTLESVDTGEKWVVFINVSGSPIIYNLCGI